MGERGRGRGRKGKVEECEVERRRGGERERRVKEREVERRRRNWGGRRSPYVEEVSLGTAGSLSSCYSDPQILH